MPDNEGKTAVRGQIVLFSDLDGTLLDARDYTFGPALPALERVRQKAIPLIFCTSKTAAEIELWQSRLDIHDPYILESGGGIFVPDSCFSPGEIRTVWPDARSIDGGTLLVLGTPYVALREALCELRSEGFEVRGLGDMDAEEVSGLTGLTLEQAHLAKQRHFDEPFVFDRDSDPAELERLRSAIRRRGFRWSMGRLHHITGDNDKGKAVDVVKKLYQRKFGSIFTVALGDTPLDFPMLKSVDYSVLVRQPEGGYAACTEIPGLYRAAGIGPEGWNEAILHLIAKAE
jgi:mannosyl-3-phosphoglycerate phosphatase family protein